MIMRIYLLIVMKFPNNVSIIKKKNNNYASENFDYIYDVETNLVL